MRVDVFRVRLFVCLFFLVFHDRKPIVRRTLHSYFTCFRMICNLWVITITIRCIRYSCVSDRTLHLQFPFYTQAFDKKGCIKYGFYKKKKIVLFLIDFSENVSSRMLWCLKYYFCFERADVWHWRLYVFLYARRRIFSPKRRNEPWQYALETSYPPSGTPRAKRVSTLTGG